MAKPMLVTLPFVLLLLDYWPLNRTAINTQNEETIAPLAIRKAKLNFLILEKIPLFVLSVISSGVTVYAAKTSRTMSELDIMPLMMRISNALVSYVLYLKKLFYPTDLAVFYPYTDIQMLQVLPAAFLLIFITALVCKYYKKHPYLAVGWFWYLGTLLPVIGIVQVGMQSMADRYAYVPFIGIFIMLVWGAADILKRRISEKVMAAISLAILVAVIALTYRQVQSWENTYTLFNQAIKTAKQNFLPYKNLGHYFLDNNQPNEAAKYFYRAIEIKKMIPRCITAWECL
jgi:hypothetical protein